MNRIVVGAASALALVVAMGCGGGAGTNGKGPNVPDGKSDIGGKTINTGEQPGGGKVKAEAADAFTQAVADFKAHETARDWDDAICAKVAQSFLAAGKAQGGKFPAAHYNAGVALVRCGKDSEAGAEFDLAISEARDLGAGKKDPEFHQAHVQKALIRFRKGDVAGITEAINAIMAKGFAEDATANVEAFVNLGMLYRERWTRDEKHPERSKTDDYGFKDDLERAQFWLQNALSINDAFMPAYNQLALFYLDKARAVGAKNSAKTAKKVKADQATLELGLLVSEEASRRDPDYAGIWNTQGLILLELGRSGVATLAFQRATQKDPKFFEAWMNYAAINLSFRSYEEAIRGYKAASGIRGKDYDAKLGLGVATRGELDYHLTQKVKIENLENRCAGNGDDPTCAKLNPAELSKAKQDHASKLLDLFKGALAIYDECVKLDGGRPEAYYDRALLIEKYKSNVGQGSSADGYIEAAKLYEEVGTKFGGNPNPAYAKIAEDAKKNAGYAREAAEPPKVKAPPAGSAKAPGATSAAPAASTPAKPK